MMSGPEGRNGTPAGASLGDLMARYPRPGRLAWIGVRPGRRQAVRPLDEVSAVAGRGLAGDHYRSGTGGTRQVTLIQDEHLAVIGSLLGSNPPDPALLRRNLVISGINLVALKGVRFQIGGAVLEYSGLCQPCSRMEEVLGPGGYNAVRGHGGINARVVSDGTMRLGDTVRVLGHSPS